jgi:UDP-N-acetylglucosamine:LPS N-acetylglucosamine transferase
MATMPHGERAANPCPMATKRCIITLGISEQPPADHPQLVRDFRPGISRLQASLVEIGCEADFILWDSEYPAGSPTHRDSPCGFKPFCFSEVAAQGYDIVLWLDATITAIKPIEYLFQCIERDGYLIFTEDHSVGAYCKDEALGPLGITREESFRMPSCWACALGLNLKDPRARAFLTEWQALATDGITFPGPRWSGVRGFPATASKDPRVKGHRYDQTAASVLALRLGMNKWHSKKAFAQFLRNNRRSIPTLLANTASARENGPSRNGTTGDEAPADNIPVLFFSRGRGRGHAVPDMAIAEEFPRLNPRLDVQFASYATGADTLRRSGWPVIDLGLPESNSYTATLMNAHALISELKPAIVIAHEEYAVLPAARMAGVPCILVTDWFPPANHVAGEAVACADAIVFIGRPGVFAAPCSLPRPPLYVGPVVRKMRYSLADRPKARRELDLPADAFVISVMPGAWATEERAPISETVLPAFRQLSAKRKCLLWLTKADEEKLIRQTEGQPDVRVLGDCESVDQIMVASDVVITKGNRGTLMDAASLGVPSISLSFAVNPVDDALIAGISSNRAYQAKATDAALLCAGLEELAALPSSQRTPPLGLHLRGGEPAALALVAEITRLTQITHPVPPRPAAEA